MRGTENMDDGISIREGALWVLVWFGVMLLYTLLDVAVQTLSAMICGIVLGLLYIRTGSIICCITAHAGYNMISYFTTILPVLKKP